MTNATDVGYVRACDIDRASAGAIVLAHGYAQVLAAAADNAPVLVPVSVRDIAIVRAHDSGIVPVAGSVLDSAIASAVGHACASVFASANVNAW